MIAKRLTCLLLLGLSACSTTEEQVVELLEQMAANPVDSPAYQQSIDELAAIGRPAARQLIARLNPDLYLGENYREFRDEQEKLRIGCALALGHIKPRGATEQCTQGPDHHRLHGSRAHSPVCGPWAKSATSKQA